MTKKKEQKSDLRLAAESAAELYNGGKQSYKAIKGLLTGPSKEQKELQKLQSEIQRLQVLKNTKDQLEALRKQKKELEKSLDKGEKKDDDNYAFA